MMLEPAEITNAVDPTMFCSQTHPTSPSASVIDEIFPLMTLALGRICWDPIGVSGPGSALAGNARFLEHPENKNALNKTTTNKTHSALDGPELFTLESSV
jgi:hypothetical protein